MVEKSYTLADLSTAIKDYDHANGSLVELQRRHAAQIEIVKSLERDIIKQESEVERFGSQVRRVIKGLEKE